MVCSDIRETIHELDAFLIPEGHSQAHAGVRIHMDNQRFDALTRGLGARTSRREAMKWIGAATLGAFGLSLSHIAKPASAQSTPGGFGDPCDMVEGSCQTPYTCFEGTCDLPRGCVSEGLPCVEDFPCCADEGLTCMEGICAGVPSTILPATGVGIPDDSRRAAGLALAGAAVVVAGKLIRDKERDTEL